MSVSKEPNAAKAKASDRQDRTVRAVTVTGSLRAAQILALRALVPVTERRLATANARAAKRAAENERLGGISSGLKDDPDAPRSIGGRIEKRTEGPDVTVARDQFPWAPDGTIVAEIVRKYDALDRLDELHGRFIEAVENGASFDEIARLRSELETEIGAAKTAVKGAFAEDNELVQDMLVQLDIVTWKDADMPGGARLAAASRDRIADLRARLDRGQPLSDQLERDKALFTGFETETGYLIRPAEGGKMVVFIEDDTSVVISRSTARVVAKAGVNMVPALRVITTYIAGKSSGDSASNERAFELAVEGLTETRVNRNTRQGIADTTKRDAVVVARRLIDDGFPADAVIADLTAKLVPPSMVTPKFVFDTLILMTPILGELVSAGHAVVDTVELVKALDEGDHEKARHLASLVLLDVAGAVPAGGKLLRGLFGIGKAGFRAAAASEKSAAKLVRETIDAQVNALKDDAAIFGARSVQDVKDWLMETWSQKLIHLTREVDAANYHKLAENLIEQELRRMEAEALGGTTRN